MPLRQKAGGYRVNRCQGWCPNSRVLVQRPWGHLLLNGRHVCMDIVEEQARQGAEHAGGWGGFAPFL